MSPIDPTSQLIAVIRAQIGAARQSPTSAQASSANKNKAPGKNANEKIAQLVSQRVQTISPTDPDGHRKAFRMFLEGVLLGEFGMEVVNDPAFYRLVDEVQQTMEGDAGVRAKIAEAGRLLLKRRGLNGE